MKADLIETMSYELRQPLNSMIERMISVLANEHEALSPSGRDSLRGVLDDGNTLMRMLQNILELWRLKQGEVSVEVQDVNLAEVIEEAIFNVRDTLQPDVVLEKRMPSALPKIRTDLAKLNQILFHLLDNAAKFTRRGRIELELRLEDGQLLCSVTDTGIGIAPDDQEQILDEFYRVDSSPDSRHRGAGLGLTLARGLIEKLGGSLSLQSEIGQGSRLQLRDPRRYLLTTLAFGSLRAPPPRDIGPRSDVGGACRPRPRRGARTASRPFVRASPYLVLSGVAFEVGGDVAGGDLAEGVHDRLVLGRLHQAARTAHDLLGPDGHHDDQGESVADALGAVLDRDAGHAGLLVVAGAILGLGPRDATCRRRSDGEAAAARPRPAVRHRTAGRVRGRRRAQRAEGERVNGTKEEAPVALQRRGPSMESGLRDPTSPSCGVWPSDGRPSSCAPFFLPPFFRRVAFLLAAFFRAAICSHPHLRFLSPCSSCNEERFRVPKRLAHDREDPVLRFLSRHVSDSMSRT